MFPKLLLVEVALILFMPWSVYCADELKVSTDLLETFREGEKATLTCRFDPPNAEVDITWYRPITVDGQTTVATIVDRNIVQPDYVERFSLAYSGTARNGNGDLLIDPVKQEDQNSYTCRVYAQAISQSFDGKLELDVQWLSAPRLSLTPEDKRLDGFVLGDNATLTCAKDGNPTPEVTWYKNNEILGNGVDNMDRYDINGTVLAIRNITLEDHDVFNCSTTNTIGSNRVKTFSDGIQLNVKHTPIVDVVFEGGNQVRCKTSSYPLPYNYKFFVDGEPQSGKDDILLLKIEGISTCANVTCEATNIDGKGIDEDEICLAVKPTPGAVELTELGVVIVGIVIGCIVVLCLTILALVFVLKKSKSQVSPKSSASTKPGGNAICKTITGEMKPENEPVEVKTGKGSENPKPTDNKQLV